MRRLLIKIIIICIAAGLCVGMLSFKNPDNEKIITELISIRVDTMDSYFCGHINLKDAVRRIKTIETGRLLETDMRSMREFFQTDIEDVTAYKITDVEINYEDDEVVCAVVKILWETDGTGGKEETEGIYSAIMEKSEKSFKLVQFF